MTKNAQVLATIKALQSLSDDPCHYAHECSDNNDPTQCSEADQESCLGCAHSKLVILQSAIITLRLNDLLEADHADRLENTLSQTFDPALRLDLAASHEYDDTGLLSPSTKKGELDIINTRRAVRDELVAIAERFA